jgi:hypothetical protein
VRKLIALNYADAAQSVLPGQPDFIFPSLDHFRHHPADCIVFSVKKTAHDRWRQMLTEGTRPMGVFVATLDEEIAAQELAEMKAAQVWLVVPARVKAERPGYAAAANVLPLESFFQNHLDPAVERWRRAGVLRPFQPKPCDSVPSKPPESVSTGFGSAASKTLRRTLNLFQLSLFD